MKKILILFLAFVATTALWAQNNVVTYTATSKLFETTDVYTGGLHINAFNVAITSHDFSNGTGTIIFAGDVTTIGDGAFYNCFDLTSVTIGNSVTIIGEDAFSSCIRLTSVIIPNSVTMIKSYAFYNCDGLTSINIPDSVKTIGKRAFSSCDGLISITIPNSITTIGDEAFSECRKLSSITIGDSVTRIGDGAFNDCSSLKGVYISNLTSWCKIDFVNISANPLYYACNLYLNNELLKDVIIPTGITDIKNFAFECCDSLASVTIPNSVTEIGDDAFWACSSLTSIVIPNSVTTIGESAFRSCSGLTSVAIPSSVTTIGESAFRSCSGLTSVAIPSSVTTIEDYAFAGCRSLTSVVIPNSVKTIKDYAFSWCEGLTSVTIPNSVTTIGDWAFWYVNNIVYNGTATWESYDKYWGAKCMNGYVDGYLIYTDASQTTLVGCSSVATGEITIPNSVTSIGGYAFFGCSGLTSVIIPNSVTTIGEEAFCYCSSLTSITIPNSVTTIGYGAFWDCNGLTYPLYNATIFVYLPQSYSGAYTITDGIKQIAVSAFYYCSGLTSVTIPSSVTTIEDGAFSGCDSLTTIISYAIIPPTCGENCFSIVNKDIPVYVPARSVDDYKQAEGWKDFVYIQGNPYDYAIVSCSTENGTISGAGNFIKGDTCTLTVTPNYGYHFVQWNDNITDNPRVFVVAQDTSFTAQIDINQYQLTVQSLDSTKGTVIGSGYYDYKSQPTISAIPKEHYHFLQWNDGSLVNPRKFTITQDTTFVAEFAPNNYQVTVTSADPNIGSCLGSGSFVYLSEQSISAKANYGYHFIQWNDGVTDNPRTIQVLSDTTFTAIFAKNIYTISTQAEHGSISGGGEYEYLSSVQLTATADEHYHFVRWNDGVTANPRTITVEGDKTYTAIFSIDQHTISVSAEHGRVIGTGTYDYGTEATLTVIPDFCYEFIGWSDGNADNPRQVVVVADAQYDSKCELIKIASGTCGDNLTWSLNLQTGVLTISGYGAMTSYTASDQTPWYPYLSYTTFSALNIENGVTHISNYAFSGYSNLAAVTIPNSVISIGESAFEDCTHLANVTFGSNLSEIGCNAFRGDFRIEEITIFAEFTPDVCSSTFDGISKQYVYLYVPENSIRKYQVDPNWNEFDIQIKSADVKPMDDENPIVTPTDQDVTITWPITDGTDTYTLTITKSGEVVCVLTFNANGQLTNIAFAAPGLNGAHQAPAATLTAQGYQFTVTGLNSGTAYSYNVTATDASRQTLAEYKGNFSTTGGTRLNTLPYEGKEWIGSKYFHNGNLIIERNGIKYTATGQRVK